MKRRFWCIFFNRWRGSDQSLVHLDFAKVILSRIKFTINCSFYPQGLKRVKHVLTHIRLRSTMTQLESLGDEDLETFWKIARPLANLPEDKHIPRWFMLSTKKLWFRLLRHIPRQLWVETLQDLGKTKEQKEYTFEDFIENPILGMLLIFFALLIDL